MEVTFTRWRGLRALKTRMAIPEVSVSLTGRSNNAGKAFLEKQDHLPPNSEGTATMAPHVIVEIYCLRRAPVTFVFVHNNKR